LCAEGDRPQISIGREVPDREGRHKGLRSVARIMPPPTYARFKPKG
jgi:hypothetical protein